MVTNRGINVRTQTYILPEKDKKLVFELTKASSEILMKSNVKIYEYEPGFVHAKSYIVDDKIGMIGTINLDYRSLTHHFENGVWFYDEEFTKVVKEDFINTFNKSILVNEEKRKVNIFIRFLRALLKLISPLL